MKKIFQLSAFSVLLSLAGCATTANQLAATPAGSQIIASAADKVIQNGLSAGATALEDKWGNPYVHSVADALRTNPNAIVDPVLIQKIFSDYGDPANKAKFKTLALDIWSAAKDAVLRVGKENAAELLAKGMQAGATATTPPTAQNGP